MVNSEESSLAAVQKLSQKLTYFFPLYRHVRKLLPIWCNKNVVRVQEFVEGVKSLPDIRRVPSNEEDPQRWIVDQLDGSNKELANEILIRTLGNVPPTETVIRGAWFMCAKHQLLTSRAGTLDLTVAGRDFLDNKIGKTEFEIDSQEAIVEILKLSEVMAPYKRKDLLSPWSTLMKNSSVSLNKSTIEGHLSWRLRNLVDRGLVESRKREYTLSDSGRLYLKKYHDSQNRTQTHDVKIGNILSKVPPRLSSNKDYQEKLKDAIRRLNVEQYAIEHVKAHYKQKGFIGHNRERDKKGWDWDFIREGSNTLHVEIKGCSGSNPIARLTRNEYTAMEQYKVDGYRLAIVTKALEHRRLYIVRFNADDGTWQDQEGIEFIVTDHEETVAQVQET